jgi:hypothetical protein
MGQYYKPCILAENKKTVKSWVNSHEYDNGLKLMEHSWMKNKFVKAFESLIKGNPQRVVWAGDYADKCKGLKSNAYDRCNDRNKVKPTDSYTDSETRYVVNHTKKTYVDKTKVIDREGWRIHPLPLLTSEGNGQGGGDYFGADNNKIIGSWARDLVSVESIKPKGFNEIVFDLFE